jgi:hypothetical protein
MRIKPNTKKPAKATNRPESQDEIWRNVPRIFQGPKVTPRIRHFAYKAEYQKTRESNQRTYPPESQNEIWRKAEYGG